MLVLKINLCKWRVKQLLEIFHCNKMIFLDWCKGTFSTHNQLFLCILLNKYLLSLLQKCLSGFICFVIFHRQIRCGIIYLLIKFIEESLHWHCIVSKQFWFLFDVFDGIYILLGFLDKCFIELLRKSDDSIDILLQISTNSFDNILLLELNGIH